MSNIPISGMTAAESIGNNDIIPIVQSGVNKKATGAQIKEYASAGKQNSIDNNLDTNDKTIVGAINEVRNYNNLVNKPIFHDGLNKSSYKIPLPKRDSNAYYNGIMFFQTGPAATFGLFLVFIGTGANPQIVVSKLGGSANTPTFTGSFDDGVLTLDSSATIYGGITYIGF